MFKQLFSKRLMSCINNKKMFTVTVVFMILMMISICFSQVAMEIYAYTLIANKIVENKKIEKLIELKNTEKTLRNKQSKKNTKKVNNNTKSTDEKNVNNNNSNVKKTYIDSSVLSFIKPLKGGMTSSYYGDTASRATKHQGHDWAVENGTKIFASEKGMVDKAYYSTSYGYNVLINHGNGIKTRYAHLSKLIVKKGQYVKQGQRIGLSGNTGDSTGPHLHFEVIVNGECCNPVEYIK